MRNTHTMDIRRTTNFKGKTKKDVPGISRVDTKGKNLRMQSKVLSKKINSKANKRGGKINNLQKSMGERTLTGPDFDDRLIRLIRSNPILYDGKDPYHRRLQVRVKIWEQIAKEMKTSSRFIQTKWKNIRYNYMQERKALETGIANPKVRKRRFTEDISFILHANNNAESPRTDRTQHNHNAFSDHQDSNNSYICAEANTTTGNNDVIEIENSDLDEDDIKVFNNNKISYHDDTGNQLFIIKNVQSDFTPQNDNDAMSNDSLVVPLHSRTLPIKDDTTQQQQQQRNLMFHHRESLLNNNENTTVSSSPGESHFSEATANAIRRKSNARTFSPALEPKNDPIELYCLSLVDSLRNMSRGERERVKFEFSKILKDAVYNDES